MIAIQKRTDELKAQGMKQAIRNEKDAAIEQRQIEKEARRQA